MERLDWGDLATYVHPPNTFDFVVAADVLYLPEHCEALPKPPPRTSSREEGWWSRAGCGARVLMETLAAALQRRGLRPEIDALVIARERRRRRNDGFDREEHEHDGAQIARAGGYVLVTCDAPEDWTPPPSPKPEPDEDVAVPEHAASSRRGGRSVTVGGVSFSFSTEPGGFPEAASAPESASTRKPTPPR